MNLTQSRDPGQFCLRGIASNEHPGANMLGGCDVDKIPSVGTRAMGVAGTQFITPLQKIG
jgi:hypothetical protein